MIDSLTGAAARVAREILAAFPDMTITSARRSVADQALQMARNTVRNRDWIAQTYARPLCLAARLCRDLAAQNPKAASGELAWIFTNALGGLAPGELRKLSRHLTGEAFDVAPGSAAMEHALRDAAIREGGRFLTCEGGLVIWHWQGP